jgi:hypothetical protein
VFSSANSFFPSVIFVAAFLLAISFYYTLFREILCDSYSETYNLRFSMRHSDKFRNSPSLIRFENSCKDPSRRASAPPKKMVVYQLDSHRNEHNARATHSAGDEISAGGRDKHDEETPRPSGTNEVVRSLEQGESFQVAQLICIPNDDYVRPTTQAGTNTPLRVNHQIVVEMKFRLQGEGNLPVKTFRVPKPITFSSVRLSVGLPYSQGFETLKPVFFSAVSCSSH